jgi:hypothetical protein
MKQVIVSASVNKSEPSVSAPFKPKNAVILTGDLASKAEGQFTIVTKNIGYKRGSTEPLEFVEEHPVQGNADAFEIGAKLTVTGFIGRVPRGKQLIHRLVAVGISATPSAKYDNRVMCAGRAMGGVKKKDPIPGKEAFGRLFIDTAIDGSTTNGVRITLFGDMLANWHRRVFPNREITVFGYLNNRPSNRFNSDGDRDIVTEVRADERKSILHGQDELDPSAAFADDAAFAPAMAMAFTEPEKAPIGTPATAPTTGKSKSGKKGDKPAEAPAPNAGKNNLF